MVVAYFNTLYICFTGLKRSMVNLKQYFKVRKRLGVLDVTVIHRLVFRFPSDRVTYHIG